MPILLSIGYAACHWCHVMAHESFEDDEVAAAMNADFVCIKVDREERPDLDAVYMNATVALTGQGGWPMTCFLTPDGRPFFCGTYYPKPQLPAAARRRRRHLARTAATRSSRPPTRSPASCGRWPSGLPGGGPEVRPRCATTPSRRCCATRTPPAADSAARRSSRRRRCWRRCCATTSAPATRRALAAVERTGDRDGPRRHLRPARRRIRPLQRRRLLGGAALREDALRQRAAAAGLRALGAAHRKPVGAQGYR